MIIVVFIFDACSRKKSFSSQEIPIHTIYLWITSSKQFRTASEMISASIHYEIGIEKNLYRTELIRIKIEIEVIVIGSSSSSSSSSNRDGGNRRNCKNFDPFNTCNDPSPFSQG